MVVRCAVFCQNNKDPLRLPTAQVCLSVCFNLFNCLSTPPDVKTHAHPIKSLWHTLQNVQGLRAHLRQVNRGKNLLGHDGRRATHVRTPAPFSTIARCGRPHQSLKAHRTPPLPTPAEMRGPPEPQRAPPHSNSGFPQAGPYHGMITGMLIPPCTPLVGLLFLFLFIVIPLCTAPPCRAVQSTSSLPVHTPPCAPSCTPPCAPPCPRRALRRARINAGQRPGSLASAATSTVAMAACSELATSERCITFTLRRPGRGASTGVSPLPLQLELAQNVIIKGTPWTSVTQPAMALWCVQDPGTTVETSETAQATAALSFHTPLSTRVSLRQV